MWPGRSPWWAISAPKALDPNMQKPILSVIVIHTHTHTASSVVRESQALCFGSTLDISESFLKKVNLGEKSEVWRVEEEGGGWRAAACCAATEQVAGIPQLSAQRHLEGTPLPLHLGQPLTSLPHHWLLYSWWYLEVGHLEGNEV